MSADAIEMLAATSGLSPLSLRDAPSFIEVQFPVGRLSTEAYKERKAGAGQTLTALGSYWKGRKPLILCRAVVLGCLLPATDDPAKDLDIFLKLMGMDDVAFLRRGLIPKPSEIVGRLTPVGSITSGAGAELFVIKRRTPEGRKVVWVEEPFDLDAFPNLVQDRSAYLAWADDISDAERNDWRLQALETFTYDERVKRAKRPEECDETLLEGIWTEVNAHIGTQAWTLAELVQQLGVARFGHRPKLADTFCGAGSIPFEAARIGCEVYASDLNPVACLLTWGAFNIIGAESEAGAQVERAQEVVAAAVDGEITRLGVEHDADGNRAKVFLYCLETRCPKTGWMVPMAPSWVIATARRTVAKLVPDYDAKRYAIEIVTGVSEAEMAAATLGTVRDGRLIHPMNPERTGVEIKTIRGDYRDNEGGNRNRLRLWEKSDFTPRPEDIFQERLYCIQWIAKETLGQRRQETFFASVTAEDLIRERRIETIVAENLALWQDEGLVPDMRIEPGEETTRLFRERGWTHWHHLFAPRQLVVLAICHEHILGNAALTALLPKLLDRMTKLCRFDARNEAAGRDPTVQATFYNQAFNTLINYGVRSAEYGLPHLREHVRSALVPGISATKTAAATETWSEPDLYVTDPPYADAINYHEITELFIAWLRRNSPPPFDKWLWDSRRGLAIKGEDEDFRRAMVTAYAAMTLHMPDNGLQVVMFTHQDAGVWADLGAILWAAGLRVSAAWNIVTETENALGKH